MPHNNNGICVPSGRLLQNLEDEISNFHDWAQTICFLLFCYTYFHFTPLLPYFVCFMCQTKMILDSILIILTGSKSYIIPTPIFIELGFTFMTIMYYYYKVNPVIQTID